MSPGQTLAAARQEAGLSIEQVSEATRIRGTVIRAIENDDYGLCGGDFYARGHIRSIGHAVGIDPEPLVREYDAAHGVHIAAPAPVTASDFDLTDVSRVDRRRPRWSWAMAAALAVICLVAAGQLISRGGPSGSGHEQLNAQASPATHPSAHPSRSPSATPAGPGPSAVAQIPPNSVTVQVRVTGAKAWLSVTNSTGQVLFQDILRQGQTMNWNDPQQLRLVIGDSGAVDLVVNGHDLGAPGKPGQVSRVVFGPGDPTGSAG